MPELDPVLSANPDALRVLTLLVFLETGDQLVEARLQGALGISMEAVTDAVGVLEAAGYVEVEQATYGGVTGRWVMDTPQGRAAFRGNVSAIEAAVLGTTAGH